MKKQIRFKLDSEGEFDEVFISNASVHIERMNDTGFWIGIEGKGLPLLMVNTGVHRGKWFFNLEEDAIDGRSFQVQRPRRKVTARTTTPATPTVEPNINGKDLKWQNEASTK